MTKLLANKTLHAVLAIAMAVLLIVALIPTINIQRAWGDSDGATVEAVEASTTEIDGDLSDAGMEDAVEDGAEEASGAGEPEGDADEAEAVEGEAADDAAAAETAEDSQTAELADETADEAEGDEVEDHAITKNYTNTNNLKVDKNENTPVVKLVYSDAKTYDLTIEGDGVLNGTIHVYGGATLNIHGTGTINGKGAATVIHVEGDNSVLNVCPNEGDGITITGGNGGTKLNDTKNFPTYWSGGGILVQRKGVASDGTGGTTATLNFYNGTVTGNNAGSGGGIHIDRGCSFYMENGTVTNNYAKALNGHVAHEAGGIYVAGSSANGTYKSSEHAYIAAATIEDNHTQTTIDWGGGGIFVESKGVLKLGTASITQNTAQGLGGGVSGCPHATIGVGGVTNQSGAAIWNNTANKNTKPFNSFLTISQVQDGQRYGDMYAYGLYNSDFSSGELDKRKTYTADKENGRVVIQNYVGKDYSKNAFKAEYAQDYYCTKVSVIVGPNIGGDLPENKVWKGYTANASGGSPFTIKKGESRAFSTGSVGLTSLLPASYDAGNRAVSIKNNTSSTHGGGIGCNGVLLMGSLESKTEYASLAFEFDKKLVNTLGEELGMGDKRFSFELIEAATGKVYKAESDAQGRVKFDLPGADFLTGMTDGQTKEVTFELREIVDRSEPDIVFDATAHQVKLTFKASVQAAEIQGSANVTSYSFVDETFTVDGAALSEFSVTNTLKLSGAWTPEAKKFYYGTAEQPSFGFTLVEVNDPAGSLANATDKVDGVRDEAANGFFAEQDGSAKVVFNDIFYTEAGEHWYKIYETSAADPTVYVVKVVVVGDGADGEPSTNLVARVAEVYYAKSAEATELKPLGADAPVEFHNNDDSFSLSGYSVNALSGAPISQKCLVDPKIVKVLEGRTMVAGEFSFQLIEVDDYADTTGDVISETSNDADGMVDFDAAANKADEGWEPSCLLFTQPGTYKYRVIEDPTQKADPSVDYSTEVITFTVVVELDRETGVLAATDMYYGYLNEAGENVRYKEQYKDWETKEKDPAWVPSVADFDDYDASWHPTMTNTAKPMDLAVQKTSALTGEALEGAIYALYQVNHGGEADLRLTEGTSDAEGWIYFEDVSLKSGTLYYFMEEAAPEGHTVSKFRSKYFYIAPDAAAGNGYALKYTDNKYLLVDPSDELVAVHDDELEADGPDADFGGFEAAVTPTAPTYGKDGAVLYVYEADGGVQDAATYVEFNKLDSRTHEWVEGAHLSIVEAATGTVVNAWVSGKAPEVLEKALNVDTVYVLREDAAPEGYAVADPVEFRIDAYGVVEILSGDDNGNAELSGSAITLYDTRLAVEVVDVENREVVREVPKDVVTRLAQTGDMVPLAALGVFALGALVALVLAARRARKQADRF